MLFLVLFALLAGLAMFFLVGWAKTRKLAKDAVQLVPQAGQLVDVTGGAIHYLDLGKADANRTLVLIHGLGGQMHHFTYALTDLLKGDFRLIVIDRPGCGYSRRDTPALAALPRQADMIWDFLDQIEVRKPVLVGHSLGGAVALAMGVARPDDTGAMALLAPLTHPNSIKSPAFDPLNLPNKTLRKLLAYTWAIPMAKSRAPETLDEVFRPDRWTQDFLTQGGGALGLRPDAFLTTVEDFFSGQEVGTIGRKYASRLTMPGGVLFGLEDAALDPQEQGRAMTKFGFDFAPLEGRGHMLPIVAARDCAAFVRRISARAV